MRAIILVSLLSFFGCLNPYSSKFTCPEGDLGKCQSIDKTYRESYRRNSSHPTEQDENIQNNFSQETSMKQKLSQSVSGEELPLVMPAEVMRIKIMPYRAEPAVLYMGRYVYVIKDRPKFIIEELTK